MRPLNGGRNSKNMESGVVDYRALPKLLQGLSNGQVLLITRQRPEEVKHSHVNVIWVTKVSHPRAVHPTHLHMIEQTVWDQLQKEGSHVIIDAIEYLMIENGVEKTLRFIGKLRDMALLQNSRFYVTVSEGVDEKTVALLRRIVE